MSSNLAHITSVLVSCYMLGTALVYIVQKMRDTVFVLGGGNECSVAMARSCAASFYNQASPCHHNSAMQKTHWEKKFIGQLWKRLGNQVIILKTGK